MMNAKWWEKLPEATLVEDMLPLLDFVDEHTIVTKDGFFVQVIELFGKDYSGLEKGVIDGLFKTRKQFIESLPPNIMPSVHSIRYEVGSSTEQLRFKHPLAEAINNEWSKKFVTSYRTRHFIVLRTAKPSVVDQIVLNIGKEKEDNNEFESLKVLNEVVNNALLRLQEYRPHLLNKHQSSSFWASHVNGRVVTQEHTDSVPLASACSGVGLFWPDGKRYQVYEDNTQDRYSAWLAIKFFSADSTTIQMLDDLYRVQETFSVYQTFQTIDKAAALSYIEDKERNVSSFSKAGETQAMELLEAKNRVETSEITLASYSFSVQVFAESLEALEKAVGHIKNVPESYGFRVARENLNQEPLFWSIFPSLENLNVRKRVVSSENISDFCSFASVGEGIESTTWGDKPITNFKTLTGSEYAFTFHPSPEPLELGHTLVIGGSNSGKTTLISYLLSMCGQYENFRTLCFDRLNGMNVFINMFDGVYNDFLSHQTGLNPFQLDDTPINRTFLSSFLSKLSGKNDDSTKSLISQIIDMNYQLQKSERTLENLELSFGLTGKGTFHEAMSKWLPEGSYGQFFTSKTDSLSFKNPLVGFDMTTLLEIPEVLAPLTSYLFHRLRETVTSDPAPYAVFVDEVIKYLESETFAPEILVLGREIRKTNGVFIMAAQEASAIIENKNGSKLIDSLATFLLYPNPTAEEKHYCQGTQEQKGLGLTKEEFAWIKKPSHRQVMLKRNGGESVILNIDLSPLGDYLNVYDSSTSAVKKMHLAKKKGGDWKNEFLK